MRKSTIVLTALASLAIAASALPETATPSGTADILRQAKTYQLQFRAGQYDVMPRYVAMLEEATKADPENADLQSALGVAYLAQAAATMLTGGKPAEAMMAGQKGSQTLEHALKLNPDLAEALATHGGVLAMMGSFQQEAQQAVQGVAEMNRAVELAPNSPRIHLQRAFSGLSLPDALRNHANEAADMDFVLNTAGKSRAADYLHIMRGDLFAELGQPDLARNQYEIAGRSASPAAIDAQARLTALSRGGVPAADMKKLRSAAGAQCGMCHGK